MAELRRRGAARPAATASSATSDFAETFKKMDVYPKTLDEFNEKTTLGGAISIISLTIIALLIVSELAAYFRVNTADHLSVDVEREREIRINLNISFPSLPCAGISLVTMDVAGEQQIDVVQNVKKSRLSADGRWLGPDDASAEGADGAGGGDERCGVCYSDPELQRQFVETVQREVAEAREQGKKINPVRTAPASARTRAGLAPDRARVWRRMLSPPAHARAPPTRRPPLPRRRASPPRAATRATTCAPRTGACTSPGASARTGRRSWSRPTGRSTRCASTTRS